MKSNLRTLLSLMLAVLLAVSLAPSALATDVVAPSMQDADAPALPIVDSPITLNIFFQQEPQVLDYNDNKLTNYLETATNIQIEWSLVLSQDKTQKLNLLLATGQNLPDVFMGGMDTSTVIEYGSQGTIIPLNDYIANDSYYFKKVMEQYPDLIKMMTAPDGNIYALPNINLSEPNMMPAHLWINQVWLDKLGLSMPTTTDELKDVLYAFKTQDPNGNGIADEIPMIGATTGWLTSTEPYLLNAFLQYPTETNTTDAIRYTVQNGVVTPDYDLDAYKDGLLYMHSLVAEGLLDPSTFTQDSKQLKQIFENPGIEIVGALTAGGPNTFANMTGSDRFRDYVAVPPLKGPDGVQFTDYDPYGYFNNANCWVITSACEDPEAAFRLGDLFFSKEISMWGRLGEPGVDYIENPEGKTAVDGGSALFEAILVYGSDQKSHWQNRNPYFNFFDNKGVASTDSYALQDLLWNTMLQYKPYAPAMENCLPPLTFTPEEARELNDINAALIQYIDEIRVAFITGGGIEEGWANYLNELNNLQYQRAVEIIQTAFNRFSDAE